MTIAELIEKHRDLHFLKNNRTGETLDYTLKQFGTALLEGLLSESKFTDNPQERLWDEVKEALEELRK